MGGWKMGLGAWENRVQEAGEERPGSGSSRRVGNGRVIQNNTFLSFIDALEYFQKQETKMLVDLN